MLGVERHQTHTLTLPHLARSLRIMSFVVIIVIISSIDQSIMLDQSIDDPPKKCVMLIATYDIKFTGDAHC